MSEKKSLYQFAEGELLFIDKPIGWTSFDTVNFIRSMLKRYHKLNRLKVGHAGTLDPLASGLLLLCTGRMTKQIQHFQDQDKVYTGSMQLGITTPSYDLETEVDAHFPTDHLNLMEIKNATQNFIGKIAQMPPQYSAIKVGGKRAFDYARKQKPIKLETREVHIHDFRITTIDMPTISFRIACSKGTYIRSLVHDFGKSLNSGACLTALRRTHIGDYSVDDALSMEQIKVLILQTAPTDTM
jgi:tRNA pseudouridine55 synthase